MFDALAYFYAKYFVSNFFFSITFEGRSMLWLSRPCFFLKLMKSIKRRKKYNWAWDDLDLASSQCKLRHEASKPRKLIGQTNFLWTYHRYQSAISSQEVWSRRPSKIILSLKYVFGLSSLLYFVFIVPLYSYRFSVISPRQNSGVRFEHGSTLGNVISLLSSQCWN